MYIIIPAGQETPPFSLLTCLQSLSRIAPGLFVFCFFSLSFFIDFCAVFKRNTICGFLFFLFILFPSFVSFFRVVQTLLVLSLFSFSQIDPVDVSFNLLLSQPTEQRQRRVSANDRLSTSARPFLL